MEQASYATLCSQLEALHGPFDQHARVKVFIPKCLFLQTSKSHSLDQVGRTAGFSIK